MQSRRELLGTAGSVVVAALAGQQGIEQTRASSMLSGDNEESGGPAETPVAFGRNVEEINGHISSSKTLLQRGRQEEAADHAGHATDYFGTVLTPLRDKNPQLATQLRGRLASLESKARSLGVDSCGFLSLSGVSTAPK